MEAKKAPEGYVHGFDYFSRDEYSRRTEHGTAVITRIRPVGCPEFFKLYRSRHRYDPRLERTYRYVVPVVGRYPTLVRAVKAAERHLKNAERLAAKRGLA